MMLKLNGVDSTIWTNSSMDVRGLNITSYNIYIFIYPFHNKPRTLHLVFPPKNCRNFPFSVERDEYYIYTINILCSSPWTLLVAANKFVNVFSTTMAVIDSSLSCLTSSSIVVLHYFLPSLISSTCYCRPKVSPINSSLPHLSVYIRRLRVRLLF